MAKPERCMYCKAGATKKIVHSEGMAYIPVCNSHLGKGKRAAAACVPYGKPDPGNIDAVRELKMRFIRTQAGADKFGGEIGDLIVPDQEELAHGKNAVRDSVPLDVDNYDHFVELFTREQRLARNNSEDVLKQYRKGGGFESFNQKLRDAQGEPPKSGTEMARDVQRIDEAMAVSKTTRPIEVWRGTEVSFFGDPEESFVGVEFIDDAYVSTSSDSGWAGSFASKQISDRYPDGFPNPVLMRVIVPKDVGAVWMGTNFDELLLDRGLTFRVVEDGGVPTRNTGPRRMTVMVVPKKEVKTLARVRDGLAALTALAFPLGPQYTFDGAEVKTAEELATAAGIPLAEATARLEAKGLFRRVKTPGYWPDGRGGHLAVGELIVPHAQPGKHWVPGTWQVEDEDNTTKVDRLAKDLLPELRQTFPTKTDAEIREVARREILEDLRGDAPASRVYRNGPIRVVIDDDVHASDEAVRQHLLPTLDELMSIAPVPRMKFRLTHRRNLANPDWAAQAMNKWGVRQIWMDESALRFTAKKAGADHLMPAAAQDDDAPALRYLAYHEWGHLTEDPKFKVEHKEQLFLNQHMARFRSRYANVHYREAYAEAWAEWHLTRGRTDNLWAKVYAIEMGWLER